MDVFEDFDFFKVLGEVGVVFVFERTDCEERKQTNEQESNGNDAKQKFSLRLEKWEEFFVSPERCPLVDDVEWVECIFGPL